jgi:hypothetical protein
MSMSKSAEILDLVAGYETWADSGAIVAESRTEAPAATTPLCAFVASYMLSRTTVIDGC